MPCERRTLSKVDSFRSRCYWGSMSWRAWNPPSLLSLASRPSCVVSIVDHRNLDLVEGSRRSVYKRRRRPCSQGLRGASTVDGVSEDDLGFWSPRDTMMFRCDVVERRSLCQVAGEAHARVQWVGGCGGVWYLTDGTKGP